MEAVSLIECDTVVSKTCPAVDDTNDQRVCVYSVTATHHGDRSDSDNPSRFSGDSKQRVLPKVTLDVCKPKLKMQNDNNDGILVRASDVKDKMEDDDVHPQGDQAASILYDERILVDSASDVWSCDRIENSESLSEISDVWDEIEILMEDDSVLLENLGPTEYNRSIKRVLVDNKGDNAGDDDQNGSSLASGDDKSTVIPTVASNASTPIPQNKVIEEVLSGIVDAEEVKSTTEAVEQPKALQSKKPAVKELKKLPIDDHKAKILERIQRHRVICVQGETGSGKSTRVPQYIVEDYRKRRLSGEAVRTPNMIITQPRRIAAKSLAKRVAQELGEEEVGGIVGYKMGREQNVSENTQICFVTTGYLIEMVIHRPADFNKYSHVIMDEIHERELDADLLSLIIRILMKEHLQPKLIIMSATLDAELFLRYFEDLDLDSYEDRLLFVGVKSPYTVETAYIEDMKELFRKSRLQIPSGASKILKTAEEKFNEVSGNRSEMSLMKKDSNIWSLDKFLMLGVYLVQATAQKGSSILIFLPGVREIEEMYDLLYPYETRKDKYWTCKIVLFPLHSKIPLEDQENCFTDPAKDTCNVILATNIAESSVTLPEISVIIDFGQRRHVVYDNKKRMSLLQLDWCSQASMNQRKGRTGRVCDGLCIRVMTKVFFYQVREFDEAQMKKAPLDKLFLRVKQVARSIAPQMAPSEVLECAVEPPDKENVTSAIKNLADIGAISSDDELSDVTMLGNLCLSLPVDLHLCRLVMFGILLNKPCDAILMAASLQSQDPFTQPSYKILKDQDRFIKSQRRSYDARCDFDRGTYSQPIMLRNMLVDWFVMVDNENKERRKQTKKKFKQPLNLKDFRKEFSRRNSLDAKRLSLLEGVVFELAEKILWWIPKDDEARLEVEALIAKIPRRRKQFVDEDKSKLMARKAEHFESVSELFADDTLLLHMILAASLVPKFVYGKRKPFERVSPNYKGKARKPRKSIEECMYEAEMDPEHTICLMEAPELEKGDVEDMIQCISLEKDIDYDDDLCSNNCKSFGYDGKKLLIEFSSTFYKRDKASHIDVTDEVNKGIEYVFQYTKEGMYQVSETRAGAAKRAEMGQGGPFRFKIPQHPYRIQWQLMCSDGNPLKDGEKFCEAFAEWRNPAGFMCDAKDNIHFGLAEGITAGREGNRCWMTSFSALPTYKQNLYSVLLLLTYLQHKHKVLFHIEEDTMVISKVTIFKYDIPIDKYYPLTKRLMKIVNKIRAITSEVFIGVDSTSGRKPIEATDLPRMYDLLIEEMESYEPDSDDEYNDYYDPRLVKVNGFYEDPNREPVEDVYLKPYNIDLLFSKFTLNKYERRQK